MSRLIAVTICFNEEYITHLKNNFMGVCTQCKFHTSTSGMRGNCTFAERVCTKPLCPLLSSANRPRDVEGIFIDYNERGE